MDMEEKVDKLVNISSVTNSDMINVKDNIHELTEQINMCTKHTMWIGGQIRNMRADMVEYNKNAYKIRGEVSNIKGRLIAYSSLIALSVTFLVQLSM